MYDKCGNKGTKYASLKKTSCLNAMFLKRM
jgi:hypothetical protein